MSKASWVGRVGITFFHKAYNLLKIWWQGAIAVFLVLFLLVMLLTWLQQKLSVTISKLFTFIVLLLGIAGLYFTYDDFQNDFSHHIMGRRFHAGFYLFWVGWLTACLFFLLTKSYRQITDTDRKA